MVGLDDHHSARETALVRRAASRDRDGCTCTALKNERLSGSTWRRTHLNADTSIRVDIGGKGAPKFHLMRFQEFGRHPSACIVSAERAVFLTKMDRPDGPAALRCMAAYAGVAESPQPEIRKTRVMAAVDQYIRAAQVPMNDALRVEVGDTLCNLE
jgi:hypothetical protein